jgi:hypothetical protein
VFVLPPMPDAATLEAMQLWAMAGAGLGIGVVAVKWLTRPGVFGPGVNEEPLHIPGAPLPARLPPPPWSLSGLRAAAFGAALGGMLCWSFNTPDEVQQKVGVAFAILGVLQSVWALLRTMHDLPVVGEPPPEDPRDTVKLRLPGAIGGVLLACLGVAMAFF